MAKKIKIAIKNPEKLEFTLEEDGKIGDYFSLKDTSNIDFSPLEKEIQIIQTKEYQKRINEERLIWEKNIYNNEQYQKLLADKKQTDEENIKLASKLNSLQENFQVNLAKQKLECEKQFYQQINHLNLEKQKIIFENNSKIANLNAEWQKKYEEITRQKSPNSKILGDELENWVESEYENNLGTLEDVKLIRTTKDVEGTKPDFIFEVYDCQLNNGEKKYQLLTTVVIEIKTQNPMSSHKNQKNNAYFAKLQKDTQNYKGEYALLISELELQNDFLIKKAGLDYPNMFVIRPAYFITFLMLIRILTLKYKEVIYSNEEFKNEQEIIDEFERLKSDIIDRTIKYLKTKLTDIISNSKKISDYSRKIEKDATEALQKNVETIVNKITGFKISQLNKKIQKLKK